MNQSQFKASKLAIVRCERDGDHWKLVFVRELASAPEAVWDALTKPEELQAWAPYTADRNLSRTGPVKLIMIDQEPPAELPSTVSAAERPTLLKHSWGQHGELRWMLEAVGTGTRLTLHHTLTQAELAPRMAAGWHLCLDVADHYLAGNPIEPIRGMDALNYGWDELRQRYADKLGIDSSPLPRV
jgi:uncharacterized protein YndB with AHSA1/START domain